MTKVIEIDIDLTPDDIVDYIINADEQAQSAILRKLSKVHYRKIGTFCLQLQAVIDDIKDSYDHDTQNNIKHMIETLHEYICEEDK